MAVAVGVEAKVRTRGRPIPAFGLIGWRWISRNPAVAITPVLLPFIFLYFLTLISPPSLLPLEIVGAMLFTTQNMGGWVLGDSAFYRLECALQDLFVASPLRKFQYLFGIAFANLIAAVPALVSLGLLLSWALGRNGTVLGPAPWLILIGCIIAVWILFSAVGIAISSQLKSQREIWPVSNLTFTVLGLLSPLYYPLSYLPPIWQAATLFLPTTYAALLVQAAFGITPASPSAMALYAGLLLAGAVIGTMVALRLYEWRAR